MFDSYARQFSPMILQLFLGSYRKADSSTRSKMEEMLLTAHTGGANGKELFGVVPQVAIDSSMVSQSFLDSYREVDQSTRSKMEEMLLT